MVSQGRAWLPIFVLFAGLLVTAPGHTAEYVVDGFKLGDPVALGSLNSQSYNCRPSNDFADATQCERSQQTKGEAGNLTLAHTLIHSSDDVAIYIKVDAAPVVLSKTVIEREIPALSRKINEAPGKIIWLPADNNWDERDDLRDGKGYHGVLIDYVGDLQFSVEHGLPIYRITGGSGYVYSASFNTGGIGHRQYAAVDSSQITARQFRLSLEHILQKDRSLADDDYRLWPDVAFAARKLARDTSPQTANDALDQVFDKLHSNKLRSHVWSILPSGGIERLAAGMYSKLDVYGVHTRYPQSRADMESLVATNPTDPFIEFAYFTIGDFDKALKTKPKIIGNLLHYAIGYAIIQTLLEDSLKIAGKHIALKPVRGAGPRDAHRAVAGR